MVIYCITNKINNKKYIGQTSRTVEQRWNQHISTSKFKSNKFYDDIKKYGKENFTFEILEECETELILEQSEIYWIMFYDTFNNGYNDSLGGEKCYRNTSPPPKKEIVKNHKKHKTYTHFTVKQMDRYEKLCK